MHTHPHVGNNRVDLRVREYVSTLCRVALFSKHDPHLYGLYPPDKRFITSGLAL